MFLIPSHIRSTLHACLTEAVTDGPHTALLLLPQGHVLCTASTSDLDWTPSTSTNAPKQGGDDIADGVNGLDLNEDAEEGEAEEEDQEDEDYEPYVATPARNRLLRGLAASQWRASMEERREGKKASQMDMEEGGEEEMEEEEPLSEIKVECELGRLLLIPIIIPTHTSTNPNTLSLNSTYDPTGAGARPPGNEGYRPEGRKDKSREKVLMLVLNGVASVNWERLEEKAVYFKDHFRSK